MLRIIVGTDWTANRDRILSQLSEDVHARRGNRILMVPELVSHDTERRLASSAGDTASRYAQVLSFSRLVRAVSEYTGRAPIACLDKGGRLVAMAAAVRQLNSKLKSYASLQTRPEFLTGLVDAVDEFKRCCISAADLRNAADRSEGVFAQKLEELSLILECYNGITAQGNRDPRDQMNWVLEQLEASDFAETHVFYIDGFPDFTRQNSAILEHFILNSPMVTVSFTCDIAGSQAMAFEKAGKSALELIRFAKENGVSYEIESVKSSDSPLLIMASRLFQGSSAKLNELDKQVQLLQADSVYAECRAAAQKILSFVRGGMRYRDIAVVCSDMAAYRHAISLVFGRCGIPLYLSGNDDVLQKNVLDGLFAALRAALDGFEQQDVIRYMKSMLGTLDQKLCDSIENYAILWAIRGSRWTKPWENHPRGLSEVWTDEDRETLRVLNAGRAKLIDPLIALSYRFHAACELSGQVQAITDFFEDIGLADLLGQLAEYMDETGDNRSAQILNQLWDILLAALEQLYDVLGGTVWDTDSFFRLLNLLLSQYDVGTIPTVLDAVMAGPVNAMRCHQVKHLIVLGASEGKLPGYTGSTGVLTDREREQLRQLNVPLTGGGMEGLASEFADIYGVFSSARETVTVTFSEGQPSFLYNRMLSMVGTGEEYPDDPAAVITDENSAAAYLASCGAGEDAKKLGIEKAYEDLTSRASYSYGSISRENIRRLYGDKLNLSASQVDKQANCRMSYFLRYGLRAKQVEEARVDPAQFGTYFHAVLEKTAKRVMELGGFHAVSLEDTTKLALEYSAAYIEENFGQLDSARMSYLFARNVEELQHLIQELWQELSVSLFEPSLFEVGFGDREALAAITIDKAAIPAQLTGFVDRVDQWFDGHNNYFRVVDYKSGKKSFDYCDVFNGVGLQMLLYMYALEQEGEALMGRHPIPAGVQYFAARFPYESSKFRPEESVASQERGKKLKRKGLVLQDRDVLSAMEPEGAPARLCIKVNKAGEIIGDCANRDQFRDLKKYVFHILRKLIAQIASGDVRPNPYTRGNYGPCNYCPYGTICHKDTVSDRRDYKTMDAQKFWEEVEKEVQRNGL